MRLQNKLLIGFTIVIALLLVRGVVGYRLAETLNTQAETVIERSVPTLTLLHNIQTHQTNLIEAGISSYLQLILPANKNDRITRLQKIDDFEDSWAGLQTSLTAFESLEGDDEAGKAAVAEFRALSQQIYDAGQYLIAEDPSTPEVARALTTMEVTGEEFVDLLNEWNADATSQLNLAGTTVISTARTVVVSANSSSFLLIIVVGVLGFIFYRTFARPMERLEQTARKIAAGDYAHRVDVTQQDEIGRVMQSFNTMATAIEKRDGQLTMLNEELKSRYTEAETARERAEQSDRVKSAFLASMSHELRTPLNSILNFSKFVLRGVMGPVTDRQTDTLEKVVKAAKHLLNLINDVLDMSKIESNSLTLFVEDDVDVRALIQSAADTAQSLLEDKPVEIKVTVSPDLPLLRADKQRILQIMLNLLSNACKFTDEGTIQIDAWHEADEVHIRIRDTGVGISPEDQTLVFEAFKQTESGLRQGGGTGLGMPISRSLAEAHQGRLWLENSDEGGATFHVALPVKSDQLAPVPA